MENPPIDLIMAYPAQLSHFEVLASTNIKAPTYFWMSLMNLLPAPPI